MIKFNLTADTVRNVCIVNEWYTRGTVSEYNEMLDWVREYCCNPENVMFELNVDLRLEYIANNILNHSDVDKLQELSDCDYFELRMHVINTLLNRCYLTVEN